MFVVTVDSLSCYAKLPGGNDYVARQNGRRCKGRGRGNILSAKDCVVKLWTVSKSGRSYFPRKPLSF